jgi:hypothetical protein
MTDLFFDFAQAENKKELELVSLRKEVEEIKSQLTDSYHKKVARDKVLAELTNVLDEMIDLFPSFVPKTLNYYNKEAYLSGRETLVTTAIMKGEKNIADIVAYVDQYNSYSGRRSLKIILAELKKTTIEEISYIPKSQYQTAVKEGCKTQSSILFPNFEQTKAFLTYQLTNSLNSLIDDTLALGYKVDGRTKVSTSDFSSGDDHNPKYGYGSQDDFVRIWGLKQQFARESLRAISFYVNNLIIINEYSTAKPVSKEICRNCEENHNIRDCTKECNGSCPRSYKSHIPKDCPARLLSDDL